MALGSYDSNGVWLHGEDDAYATFSARLNKGQQSNSDAITTLRNALNKATIAKVRRSAAWPISTAAGTAVQFDGEVISLAGAWASTPNPSRLVLPKVGYWRVSATAAGTSMDANLLRAWLALNGAEVVDSRQEINGTAGKNDPFARISATVLVANTTGYVELFVSTEAASKSLRSATAPAAYTTLTAEWIGTV